MISSDGSMPSADEYKRTFFFGSWYEKFCRVMGDWKSQRGVHASGAH